MMNSSQLNVMRAASLAALLVSVAYAGATTYDVRKNAVIPVQFDSRLSTTDSSQGDHFSATIKHTDMFPDGTRFDGHVVKVEQKTRRHAASLDLAFDAIILPDGTRQPIEGVPIPLSDKYVDKDRDGHYAAKSSIGKDTAVGIGALGGLIVGAILHKPFEGAFVGTLAGILVASTAGNGDQVLVLEKGAEAGVLFKRPVKFDTNASAEIHSNPPVVSDGGAVRIGDRSLVYSSDLAPYRIGSTLMVPIESTAKQLGLNFDVTDSSIYVENDNHSLRFEQNSANYRFDGRSNNLSAATEKRNGVWYAPASAFEGMTSK